ncbi:HNH endonuclease [Microbacterium sp. W1N]|uniref:HNH endonuclease n=1 Tax=Microbacterium festucae TaxID=2977531 RepID=UPI0021C0D31A|nr:HNH endonuclease [Microbacterium festucae]MCT9819513.1 HNH endonuclease [Microbacterium festucae]
MDWWGRDSGPTDLANGILLCTACHHRVHDDGWEIRIDGPGTAAQVWFLPPPWLDPARTPRPGGRRRYALTA